MHRGGSGLFALFHVIDLWPVVLAVSSKAFIAEQEPCLESKVVGPQEHCPWLLYNVVGAHLVCSVGYLCRMLVWQHLLLMFLIRVLVDHNDLLWLSADGCHRNLDSSCLGT